jgi:hypothetical protein
MTVVVVPALKLRRYGARRGCHHAWEEPSERDPVGGHLRHGWIHGRSHQTFSALTVPENRIFVLTDVIVFPLVEKSDPDFVGRYRIEEHAPGAPIGTGSKFQYNTVGTGENWSQHFTSGIKFAGKQRSRSSTPPSAQVGLASNSSATSQNSDHRPPAHDVGLLELAGQGGRCLGGCT